MGTSSVQVVDDDPVDQQPQQVKGEDRDQR
jgi:hypothetical protein